MDFYTLKQKEINNLLNLKGSCLGLNNLTSSVLDYKDEFRILEWTTKDKVKRLNVFTSSNNQEKLLKFAVLLSAFEDRAVEFKIQEENVVETMKNCENIKLWLWVGSSFDYFIGFQKRAPKAWRAIWLEWLYRLITWPRKLERIKRLWRAIFVFIF